MTHIMDVVHPITPFDYPELYLPAIEGKFDEIVINNPDPEKMFEVTPAEGNFIAGWVEGLANLAVTCRFHGERYVHLKVHPDNPKVWLWVEPPKEPQ